MKNRLSQASGFTLLELLMVVIIIAILASIALPQYIKAAEKARASEALTAIGALRAAEQRYKAQSSANIYTTVLAELDADFGNPAGDLPNWNGLVLDNGGGATPAVGFVQYTRSGGQFTGQTLGIQLTSGNLCGSFTPMQPLPACASG